jgi:hypothetical protein
MNESRPRVIHNASGLEWRHHYNSERPGVSIFDSPGNIGVKL